MEGPGPAWRLCPGTAGVVTCVVHSVPDDSAASCPEDRDPNLLLQLKDSEHRAILYKILSEEQNQVASNLQECLAQVRAVRGLLIPPGPRFLLS